jgi:hypothetical protein
MVNEIVLSNHVAICERFDVCSGSGETQLAQISLEPAVDFRCHVALALGLFNIELGLLGHCEWNILFWWRALQKNKVTGQIELLLS